MGIRLLELVDVMVLVGELDLVLDSALFFLVIQMLVHHLDPDCTRSRSEPGIKLTREGEIVSFS